jgi:hypothetical protein
MLNIDAQTGKYWYVPDHHSVGVSQHDGGGVGFKTTEMIQRKVRRVVLYRRNPFCFPVCQTFLYNFCTIPERRRTQSVDGFVQYDDVWEGGAGSSVLVGFRGWAGQTIQWEIPRVMPVTNKSHLLFQCCLVHTIPLSCLADKVNVFEFVFGYMTCIGQESMQKKLTWTLDIQEDMSGFTLGSDPTDKRNSTVLWHEQTPSR